MISAVSFTSIDLNDHILDFLLRLVVAAVCGFAIGYERTARSKEVGIRTHTIVCMAAALIMIVSKYAFGDIPVGSELAAGTRGADSARIAAQVVSGIGFLGAGIIIYRRDMLHGLTTAAGIWLTAGIGLALGAGMYIIGVVSAVLLVVLQLFLHKAFWTVKYRMIYTFRLMLKMDEGVMSKVHEIFDEKKILKYKTTQKEDGIIAEVELATRKIFTEEEIYRLTKDNDYIIQIEKTDEI